MTEYAEFDVSPIYWKKAFDSEGKLLVDYSDRYRIISTVELLFYVYCPIKNEIYVTYRERGSKQIQQDILIDNCDILTVRTNLRVIPQPKI